jgi:hypothetical protein
VLNTRRICYDLNPEHFTPVCTLQPRNLGTQHLNFKSYILHDRFRDSVCQKVTMSFLRSFLARVNFVFLLAKCLLVACARFRLFAHTKRDIAVAGHMRCGTFSGKGGSSFALCKKCSLDAQKNSAVRASPKEFSDWDRTDDLWVFVQTHGNLSLRGWRTESRNWSYNLRFKDLRIEV